MTSRDDILAALRAHAPPAAAAPELDALGVTFADPLAELARSMVTVGGSCLRVASLDAASEAIAALPSLGASPATGAPRTLQIVSRVPGLGPDLERRLGQPLLDLTRITDPHALAGLDLAILPGALAVAENAAVWVDGAALHHRAVFVITDHLVLVVHARDVVHHMHQAYDRLAGRPRGHGLFISGPSKTADIEQVLVVGAQGARTCTLLVIG